jgi:hypothetical protein
VLARTLIISAASALLLPGSVAFPHGPALPRMRGFCWEAAGPISPAALRPLADLGVNWISQTPFGWCSSPSSREVVRASDGRAYWGERDAGLAATAKAARALGIRTLLKPHLWVGRRSWPGDLDMGSEAGWRDWFESYERFLLHYARLAERERFDGLAIGTEIEKSTAQEARWRRLISDVRRVYHGRLTYCANWESAERVPFWDALDFIGVQAYYPLSAAKNPSENELRAAWRPIAERLRRLSERYGRRIVFTEVGYRSQEGALAEPWRWDAPGSENLGVQKTAFAALFDSIWAQPWLEGVFVWKWNPRLPAQGPLPGRARRDFTPQGKPALDVIRDFYRREGRGPISFRAGKPPA